MKLLYFITGAPQIGILEDSLRLIARAIVTIRCIESLKVEWAKVVLLYNMFNADNNITKILHSCNGETNTTNRQLEYALLSTSRHYFQTSHL